MVEHPEVLWIPSHPAQGAISMQRYWHAIREAVRGMGRVVGEALEEPEIPVSAAGKMRRYWEIYRRYPERCRKVLSGGGYRVAHLLDHSFAHLLKVVPEGCRSVVTVHDLIPLREPGGMTGAQVERFRGKMELLKKADRLVAVSGSTRDDLIQFLGIPEENISVVPNGVALTGVDVAGGVDLGALLGSGGEKRLTVLSIGLAVKRKNLGILPEVFRAHAEAGGVGARLVRVGDRLPAELRSELDGVLGEGNVIECGRVGDAELAALYGAADALIFPSTYEGFGLPVLEAMGAGCPVVASGIPSHREVGGGSVDYFEPDDAAAAGRLLVGIAGGGEMLEKRVEAGKARAREFTWERHVEGLYSVYGELLKRG